jgi:pre-mRNA-splicing factor SYF2
MTAPESAEASRDAPAEDLQPAEAPIEAPAADSPATGTPENGDVVSKTDDAKSALATRMARFKTLQAQRDNSRKANEKAARTEENERRRDPDAIKKLQQIGDRAAVKLLKDEDPDFERKRAWDYTVDEDEKWSKREAKKARNRDNVAFSDYTKEANKVYKRQIKQMEQVDAEVRDLAKAEKLKRQVSMGLLTLVEEANGEIYTVDKDGRVNTPVEENYNCDHKPSKEAIDKLVSDLEKGERARLKARAARGLKDDDSGDVTYINHKVSWPYLLRTKILRAWRKFRDDEETRNDF